MPRNRALSEYSKQAVDWQVQLAEEVDVALQGAAAAVGPARTKILDGLLKRLLEPVPIRSAAAATGAAEHRLNYEPLSKFYAKAGSKSDIGALAQTKVSSLFSHWTQLWSHEAFAPIYAAAFFRWTLGDDPDFEIVYSPQYHAASNVIVAGANRLFWTDLQGCTRYFAPVYDFLRVAHAHPRKLQQVPVRLRSDLGHLLCRFFPWYALRTTLPPVPPSPAAYTPVTAAAEQHNDEGRPVKVHQPHLQQLQQHTNEHVSDETSALNRGLLVSFLSSLPDLAVINEVSLRDGSASVVAVGNGRNKAGAGRGRAGSTFGIDAAAAAVPSSSSVTTESGGTGCGSTGTPFGERSAAAVVADENCPLLPQQQQHAQQVVLIPSAAKRLAPSHVAGSSVIPDPHDRAVTTTCNLMDAGRPLPQRTTSSVLASNTAVYVMELTKHLRGITVETSLVHYLLTIPALSAVHLDVYSSNRLQVCLASFTSPGGPLYPTRPVRHAAMYALDTLFPGGRLARRLVSYLFRLLHPMQWPFSLGHWLVHSSPVPVWWRRGGDGIVLAGTQAVVAVTDSLPYRVIHTLYRYCTQVAITVLRFMHKTIATSTRVVIIQPAQVFADVFLFIFLWPLVLWTVLRVAAGRARRLVFRGLGLAAGAADRFRRVAAQAVHRGDTCTGWGAGPKTAAGWIGASMSGLWGMLPHAAARRRGRGCGSSPSLIASGSLSTSVVSSNEQNLRSKEI